LQFTRPAFRNSLRPSTMQGTETRKRQSPLTGSRLTVAWPPNKVNFTRLSIPNNARTPRISLSRSTTGCRVLRLPQRRTCSFRCRSLLWLRRHGTFGLRLLPRTPARPVADFPGSDRRGSAQLDRWLTSDSRRLLRASDRPMAIHPACAERPLHQQGRRSTADSHRILIL
jgi:hypothetical protein